MLHIGQTEVVREEDEVGDIEVLLLWEEWQEGVLRADSPADRAIWRSGTEGRDNKELWVCMNSVERVVQREGL